MRVARRVETSFMTFNQWWYDFKIKNHGRQPERSIAEAAWAAARMAAAPSEGVTCPECATARAAANSWKDELMRLKSAQPAARATKDFAALCRPAVKSALTKAEMSLLGKYPDHYKPILEGEANRMRELLDEIDAILDGRGVSATGEKP